MTYAYLSTYILHLGAVILYQENDFHYHFSARLERWVHYVPLAYNMADATDMIEWLIDHDDLAQRLAINARNFGTNDCMMIRLFMELSHYLYVYITFRQVVLTARRLLLLHCHRNASVGEYARRQRCIDTIQCYANTHPT